MATSESISGVIFLAIILCVLLNNSIGPKTLALQPANDLGGPDAALCSGQATKFIRWKIQAGRSIGIGAKVYYLKPP
jgi:hypothetical protein